MPTQSHTRTEHDSLGEVNVPVDALYGAQTQRAVENFPVSGLRMPREFIHALGIVKCACARANLQLKKLEKEKAESIAKCALDVAEGRYDEHFPVDVFQTGSGTSSNMNANEVIATLARTATCQAIHPNDHVNMGQSSNDVIPTCLHLSASLGVHSHLLPALTKLEHALSQKSRELCDVVKTGRTHLMDAMPLTFGQEIGAWSQQMKSNIERIKSSLPRLQGLAIGGTAVGTGVNTHPEFASLVVKHINAHCAECAFTVTPNYFEALSCQDTAAELSGQLKVLAVSLMKISNDLRWMNSGPLAGIGEITLEKLQPGSSIMPGKVNPVIPESVAQVAAQVIGNDAAITVAAQSGNFQLNVMLPLIAHNLLESLRLLSAGANLLADKAVSSFSVNIETIERTLEKNPVLVTALNEIIGYEKSAQIAQRAYKEKRSILEVAKEMTDIEDSTLNELLDPKKLVGQGK